MMALGKLAAHVEAHRDRWPRSLLPRATLTYVVMTFCSVATTDSARRPFPFAVGVTDRRLSRGTLGSTDPSTGISTYEPGKEQSFYHEGLCTQEGRPLYTVIYEGRDPVTGKERRAGIRPARTGRSRAARHQARRRPKGARRGPLADLRSLPDQPMAPGQAAGLATSTYQGYERNVAHHILPALGAMRFRRLRPHQIEALYDSLLHPTTAVGSPRRPSTRSTSSSGRAHRRPRRGLVTRNVALVARAPSSGRSRRSSRIVDRGRVARSCGPRRDTGSSRVLWLTAMTGMRRNEVLGLKWPDIDFDEHPSINRGLVAVGYEVHQSRGKTRTARRRSLWTRPPSPSSPPGTPARKPSAAAGIDNAEQWVFTDGDGEPVHPHAVSQASSASFATPGCRIRFHDLRHTHGSLLIKAIPVKVVSERLGHAHRVHHPDLPACPARHAGRRRRHRRTARHPSLPADETTEERRGNGRRKTA